MKKTMLIAVLAASSLGLSACQFSAGAGQRTDTAERNGSAERSESTRNSAREAGKSGDEGAREGGEVRQAAVSGGGGDATNQNFTLNNRSSDVITHVYVSAVSDNAWGEDVLGSQVIGAGQAATITFPRQETQCNWDLRLTINNDANQELRNVNLCQTTEVNYN